ncbi:BA75_00639T0 [Komagataella pastoris]|uniref:BA75_00639T0 n=1 Tax=Komagataella pastoris TaxID=4922 RepID=A0A1B2J8D5_PICPA|nr:BA75_00639T0 [Komagataella pastoris]
MRLSRRTQKSCSNMWCKGVLVRFGRSRLLNGAISLSDVYSTYHSIKEKPYRRKESLAGKQIVSETKTMRVLKYIRCFCAMAVSAGFVKAEMQDNTTVGFNVTRQKWQTDDTAQQTYQPTILTEDQRIHIKSLFGDEIFARSVLPLKELTEVPQSTKLSEIWRWLVNKKEGPIVFEKQLMFKDSIVFMPDGSSAPVDLQSIQQVRDFFEDELNKVLRYCMFRRQTEYEILEAKEIVETTISPCTKYQYGRFFHREQYAVGRLEMYEDAVVPSTYDSTIIQDLIQDQFQLSPRLSSSKKIKVKCPITPETPFGSSTTVIKRVVAIVRKKSVYFNNCDLFPRIEEDWTQPRKLFFTFDENDVQLTCQTSEDDSICGKDSNPLLDNMLFTEHRL